MKNRNNAKTRAQRLREADALLCAAKHWQKYESVDWCCCEKDVVLDISRGLVFDWLGLGALVFDMAASAALSEAARLADDELVNEED